MNIIINTIMNFIKIHWFNNNNNNNFYCNNNSKSNKNSSWEKVQVLVN